MIGVILETDYREVGSLANFEVYGLCYVCSTNSYPIYFYLESFSQSCAAVSTCGFNHVVALGIAREAA